MDTQILNMIIERIDRIEQKVDHLLEFKWKAAGIAIAVGVITAASYQLFLAFIQRGI